MGLYLALACNYFKKVSEKRNNKTKSRFDWLIKEETGNLMFNK